MMQIVRGNTFHMGNLDFHNRHKRKDDCRITKFLEKGFHHRQVWPGLPCGIPRTTRDWKGNGLCTIPGIQM